MTDSIQLFVHDQHTTISNGDTLIFQWLLEIYFMHGDMFGMLESLPAQ